MKNALFVTGIGTEIGKTLVAAILAEALQADYWKPVQCGSLHCTDAETVGSLISNASTTCHPEGYRLETPASPHLAARQENVNIDLRHLREKYDSFATDTCVVVEGAGGILVPLNETEFNVDLIKTLDASVVIVSRNYLGSINHSLLTSAFCRQRNLKVVGWVFNDQFMDYEDEIVAWSGYPKLGTIPYTEELSKEFVRQMAALLAPQLKPLL